MAVKAMSLEDMKMRILLTMDKMQTNRHEWFTISEICREAGTTTKRGRAALYELAVEGFLRIRHDSEVPDMLRYRVRRDGESGD